MISRILVATDGSAVAQKAVKYAIDLAGQTRAKVTILTVIDDRALIAQYIPAEMSAIHLAQPVEQYLKTAAQKYLGRAERLCEKSRVSCVGIIRNGSPVDEILSEARKSKADIIVLGSHGRGTIESAVLGSVTYGVIHKNSKYPVLVIRK